MSETDVVFTLDSLAIESGRFESDKLLLSFLVFDFKEHDDWSELIVTRNRVNQVTTL